MSGLTVLYTTVMHKKHRIEIFGYGNKAICAGCDGHDCAGCGTESKQATSELVAEFQALLAASDLAAEFETGFIEASDEAVAVNPAVASLLSMAELDPIICIDGSIAYMGGFSPSGLIVELQKKYRGNADGTNR